MSVYLYIQSHMLDWKDIYELCRCVNIGKTQALEQRMDGIKWEKESWGGNAADNK